MPTVAELSARVSVEGVAQATGQLAAFGGAVQKTGADAGTAAVGTAKYNTALRTVGTGALVMGGALLAGFGLATGAVIDFDRTMSTVEAVSDTSAAGLGRLRDAAIEAGQATVFSASQAAQAEAELARAGISTADILGGALTGSLDLAAAGQIDLAEAATIAAQAMNIFGLGGSQVTQVADLLAAAANKSAADVHQLGESLRMGGLLAAQTGLSIEETVGALALFADNALIGSDAGTSLKAMLQRLTPISAEAESEMRRLGISAYDAQGNFIGLEAFAGNLRTSLSGLTDEQRNAALATIFGADAVRAANILYKAGAEGVREYENAVNDQGAAARMAGVQLDNLGGDLEQLRGSVETALIQGGSGATTVLRSLAQGATTAVNAFSGLPAPVQAAVFGLGGLAGATVAALGGLGLIASSVGKGVSALKTFSTAMTEGTGAASRFVGALGGIGPTALLAAGALVVVGAAAVHLANKKANASAEVNKFKAAMDAEREGVRGATQELIANELAVRRGSLGNQSFIDIADRVGISHRTMSDAIRGNGDAWDRLSERREAASRVTSNLSQADRNATAGLINSIEILRERYGQADEESRKAARANDELGDSAGKAGEGMAGLEDGLGGVGDAAGDAAGEVATLKQTMDSLFGLGANVENLRLQFASGLLEIQEALKEGTFTLDENTSAGARNQLALQGLATTARDHAAAVYDQVAATHGESTALQFANATLGEHLGQLVGVAMQTGKNEEEAARMVGTLLGIPPDVGTLIHNTADLAAAAVLTYIGQTNQIPPNKLTEIIAESATAEEALLRVQAYLAGIQDKNVNVRVNFEVSNPGVLAQINNPKLGRQHGGPVPGPKGRAVPILAHGGEYVLDPGTVDAIKRGRESAGAETLLPASAVPGGPDVNVNLDLAALLAGVSETNRYLRRLEKALVPSAGNGRRSSGPGPLAYAHLQRR